jgi:hypothetical protein
MNYTELPPGRNRRIAYSNYISSNITRRHLTRQQTVRQQPRRRTLRQSQVYFSVSYYELPSYNVLSQLKDVKVGIEFKNLVNKSKVEKCEENKFCAICQDDIIKDDIIRVIKCKHSYHIDCIDMWLIDNKKCPLCKFEI